MYLIPLPQVSQSIGDVLGNLSLEGVEDGECEGNVEDDTRESGANTAIEAHDSLVFVNLREAVDETVVFVGIYALHLGLDHVHRVVEHGGAETGEGTREQINEHFVGDFVGQEFLGVSEDHKTDSLVGRLFQESRCYTLVDAAETLSLNDRVDSVEHVAELWLRGKFIVDKSGLESFLRCDNKDSFTGTGCKTAEEVVCLGLLRENVRLCVLICAKTHVVLWDGEHE